MDLTQFADDSFDPAEWINKEFESFEGGDKKEFISTYISKIDELIEKVNLSIENTTQEVVAGLPQIIEDIKNLHIDVQNVQKTMNNLHNEMKFAQEETGEVMESLEELNNKQIELEAAKESLQQSDGWGNLLSELEDCFELNDLSVICDKLVSMQKSLLAQEKLPGHSDRVAQAEDFKNRLEALASPAVVEAFATGDVADSLKYVKIFDKISRLEQLKQYYRAVQKNSIQRKWKEIIELADNSNQFLSTFYDYLLDFFQRQCKWCMEVFGDKSINQPFLIISEILPALEPTRDAFVIQILKTSNDKVELLRKLAVSNRKFISQIISHLENNSIVLTDDQMILFAKLVFEYFFKFIQQYHRIEESNLFSQIDRLIKTHTNASDAIRHLDDCNQNIFEYLNETCQRCHEITDDLAIVRLITIFNGIFKRLIEIFLKTQRQLNLSITGHEHNWTLLQSSMSLLQCLSDFQNKLNKFEKCLLERMSALNDKITKTTTKTVMSIYIAYDKNELKRISENINEFQKIRDDNPLMIVYGIFPNIYESLKSIYIEAHDTTLMILLSPIEQQLRNIQPIGNLNNSISLDMPEFSYTPQECITQVGQYLLTLLTHLEPLLLSPSVLLKSGLEMCNTKYSQKIPCADVLLSLVVEQCCAIYQSQILQIKSISPAAAKQISVDIEYLTNVIDELGLSITPQLKQILNLLKASPESYRASSSGCEPRLVSAIRQMRNIISTE